MSVFAKSTLSLVFCLLPGIAVAGESHGGEDAPSGTPIQSKSLGEPELGRLDLGRPILHQEALQAETSLDVSGPCSTKGRQSPSAIDAAPRERVGCAFADTRLGLSFATRLTPDFGDLTLTSSFGRTSDASFSLDRQIGVVDPGQTRERMVANVGMRASMAGGDIVVASEMGWTRHWSAPITPHPVFSKESRGLAGSAQRHSLEIAVIKTSEATLSLDAHHSSTTGMYLPLRIGTVSPVFALSGTETAIGAKARFSDLDLHLRVIRQDGAISRRDQAKVTLGYGGISVNGHMERHTANASAVAFGAASIASSMSAGMRTRGGIEIVPMVLFPQRAAQDDLVAKLMPLSLGIEIGRRDRQRSQGRERTSDIALTGLWSTPLGDTLLTFNREAGGATNSFGETKRQSDSTVLIDHSFALGDWKFGASIMTLDTKYADRTEGNAGAFYSLSASKRSASGPDISLRLGRDRLNFSTGGGDFELRDRSTKLLLEADFSRSLNTLFEREDLLLRLQSRVEFGKSGYEIRFLDEVLAREFENQSGHGLMLSFGMEFPRP